MKYFGGNVRVFVKILSPGRANESRLSAPPVSPTPTSNSLLDSSAAAAATNTTPEMKRSIVKEASLVRSSLEEDHEHKTDSSGAQQAVNRMQKKHST